MPDEERKELMVSIMLTPKEHAALVKGASEDERSVSGFGRLLLKQQLHKLGFLDLEEE